MHVQSYKVPIVKVILQGNKNILMENTVKFTESLEYTFAKHGQLQYVNFT